MKKYLAIYLLLLLCPLTLFARQITENEAKEKAYSFLTKSKTHAYKAPATTSYTLTPAHITHDCEDENLLYIFNRSDKGFVIVAGDDSAEYAILGYSDEGYFDTNNIPTNMRNFLATYKQELQWARNQKQDRANNTYRTQFDKDVAPLIEARWGQDAPYNALCPSYNNNQAPTGCVATAMAQIMYHHKWPKNGSGKIELYETSRTEVIDFANTTYEWDLMTPIYSSLSSEAECNAIATLMYHVGRSVNMMYGDASGAVTAEAARALATYWKYDKAIIHRDRQYYTIAEWERMIKEEIDNNRPIIYHGQSPEGGHAFVLDGYNSDGYVHINWGWNGMSNGYFMLHALTPEKQGTGGFAGGYNTGQGAIFGIQPNVGNKTTIEITAQGFTIPSSITYRIGEIISTVVTGIANAGWNNTTFGMGYMIHDSIGNFVTAIHSCNLNITANSSLGTRNIMLTLPDTLSNGRYRIYPAYTDANGMWKHVAMSMNVQPYQIVDITDGKVIVVTPDEGTVWATDVRYNDEALYANRYTSFTATMSNTTMSEFHGSLFVSIFERTGRFEQRRSDPIAISIPAGQEIEIEIPMRVEVNKGTYCIFITDDKRAKLSDTLIVSVLDEPEAPVLNVSNFTLTSTAKDELRVSYTATNTGNDYTGIFRAWVQFSNLQYTSSYDNTESITLKQDESVDIEQTWRFDDGVVGENYICTLWCQDLRKGGMKQLTNENISFTLSEPTDLDVPHWQDITIYPNPAKHNIIVNSTEPIEHISIYNTRGELVIYTTNPIVNVSHLAKGMYYVTTNNNATNKLLIK